MSTGTRMQVRPKKVKDLILWSQGEERDEVNVVCGKKEEKKK